MVLSRDSDFLEMIEDDNVKKTDAFAFTTNDKKIFERLTKFQFDEPEIYARELVANAVDSEATEIDVKVGKNWFIIDDDGCGMTPDDIKDYFLNIYNSSTKEELNKIGRFGIGLLSSFVKKPYKLVVDTYKDGVNTEFYIDEFLGKHPMNTGVKTKGTRITIMGNKKSENLLRGYGKVDIGNEREEEIRDSLDKNSGEEQKIRKYCKYVKVPVYVNGKKINRKINVKDVFMKIKIDEEDLQGEVGIHKRKRYAFKREKDNEPGVIKGLKGGVYLDDIKCQNDLTGIVNYENFDTIISRNKILKDDNYDEFLDKFEKYEKILYTEAMKKTEKLGTEELKYTIKDTLLNNMAEYMPKMKIKMRKKAEDVPTEETKNKDGKKKDNKSNNNKNKKKKKTKQDLSKLSEKYVEDRFLDTLMDYKIFTDLDRRELSLYEIIDEVEEKGKIPFYATMNVINPKSVNKIIIKAKRHGPEHVALEELFGKGLREYTNRSAMGKIFGDFLEAGLESFLEFGGKIKKPIGIAGSYFAYPFVKFRDYLNDIDFGKDNGLIFRNTSRDELDIDKEAGIDRRILFSKKRREDGLVTVAKENNYPEIYDEFDRPSPYEKLYEIKDRINGYMGGKLNPVYTNLGHIKNGIGYGAGNLKSHAVNGASTVGVYFSNGIGRIGDWGREHEIPDKFSNAGDKLIEGIWYTGGAIKGGLQYVGGGIKKGVFLAGSVLAVPFGMAAAGAFAAKDVMKDGLEERKEKKLQKKREILEEKKLIENERLDLTREFTDEEEKSIADYENDFLKDLNEEIHYLNDMSNFYGAGVRDCVYSGFKDNGKMLVSAKSKNKINRENPIVKKIIEKYKDDFSQIYLAAPIVMANDIKFEGKNSLWTLGDYVDKIPSKALNYKTSDFRKNPEKYYKKGAEEFKRYFDTLTESQKTTLFKNLVQNTGKEKGFKPDKEIDNYLEKELGHKVYENVITAKNKDR